MSGTDVVRTKPSLFEKGHAKMGGRQKGSKNRFGGDLREAVVAGIQVFSPVPALVEVQLQQ